MNEFNIKNVVQQLAAPLQRKRENLGLSLSDVGKLIGVGSSTLSRIERNVGKPDAETIAAVANWLEIPLDRIYREDLSTLISLNKSLPVIVTEQLQKDENLTPEAKNFLSKFFSHTYQQFLIVEKKRKSGGNNAPTSL